MTEPPPNVSVSRVSIATHFGVLGESIGTRGALGELIKLLASGEMDVAAFAAIRRRHAVDDEPWFRKQVNDLFLGYVRATLEGAAATAGDLIEIRNLRLYLRIKEGELLEHRPSELSELLSEQIQAMLDDRIVTASEELLQVELQSALGIGYDDYLSLTRFEFERLHTTLRAVASQGGLSTEPALQQLRAIEPIYWLAASNSTNTQENVQ
jgi:hypothetical protein